jgi:hypothetical protein
VLGRITEAAQSEDLERGRRLLAGGRQQRLRLADDPGGADGAVEGERALELDVRFRAPAGRDQLLGGE